MNEISGISPEAVSYEKNDAPLCGGRSSITVNDAGSE